MIEYTSAGAEKLSTMSIPGTGLPADIKILWCEPLDHSSSQTRICTGIHSHSFYELHYVFCGSANYVIDGKIFRVFAGKALFVPAETSHCFFDCSEDIIKVSVAFSVGKNCDSAGFLASKETCTFEISEDISENAAFILKISEKADVFMPHIVSGRILEMVRRSCIIMDITVPAMNENRTDPRIEVAKNYIENNCHRIISCGDVARECCLSQRQLNRVFKKSTGYSVFEYISETRTKYAKTLLLQNNCSIKEIGYMMGFENESSFVLFFKRQCGMPPGEFRKQNCTDQNMTAN